MYIFLYVITAIRGVCGIYRMYIYVYMHICIHAYNHMYIYLHIYKHTHIFKHVYIHLIYKKLPAAGGVCGIYRNANSSVELPIRLLN
jgi:hypothetical protein